MPLKMFHDRTQRVDELSSHFRERLVEDSLDFEDPTNETVLLFNLNVNSYNESMKEAIQEKGTYFTKDELMACHDRTKTAVANDFAEKLVFMGDELAFSFRQKIEKDIDLMYSVFEEQNRKKREDYYKEIEEFNGCLVFEIILKFDESMESQISYTNSYFSDDDLWNLYVKAKDEALNEFDTKKTGDDQLCGTYLLDLELELENLHKKWDQFNRSKKKQFTSNEHRRASVYSVIGAMIGIVMSGFPGAIAGVLFFLLGSGFLLWALKVSND